MRTNEPHESMFLVPILHSSGIREQTPKPFFHGMYMVMLMLVLRPTTGWCPSQAYGGVVQRGGHANMGWQSVPGVRGCCATLTSLECLGSVRPRRTGVLSQWPLAVPQCLSQAYGGVVTILPIGVEVSMSVPGVRGCCGCCLYSLR